MVAGSSSSVLCPECGQSFSARGISAHRRQRHGLAPAPALPRAAEEGNASLSTILDALSSLQETAARLESKLNSLEGVIDARETSAAETARLERELGQLLLCIAHLKSAGLASTKVRAQETAAEQHASLELARMRRDQARIVYRLEELRQGFASDDRFLV